MELCIEDRGENHKDTSTERNLDDYNRPWQVRILYSFSIKCCGLCWHSYGGLQNFTYIPLIKVNSIYPFYNKNN